MSMARTSGRRRPLAGCSTQNKIPILGGSFRRSVLSRDCLLKRHSRSCPSNALLIATNRGIVTYYPHKIARYPDPDPHPKSAVHDLSELSSTIALDYPQNSLLVEVAGQSSRTFPEEFQYAFDLKNAKGEIVARRLSGEAQYARKISSRASTRSNRVEFRP